jgi:RNA polymerase sigma factor
MSRQDKQDILFGEVTMEVALLNMKQQTNQVDRSSFIERYIPFIVKQVAMQMGRYVASETDEAFLIGLEAFNEAIDRYEAEKGSFINLASLIIKSRILDYQRKEARLREHEVLMDPQDPDMLNLQSQAHFEEAVSLKEEIDILKSTLMTFDLTLSDVAEQSPVHSLVRHTLLQFCKQFVTYHHLMDKLLKSKQMPIKESVDLIAVSQKQIKSHRAYVIAVIIVIHKNLVSMTEYLRIEGVKHDKR